MAKIIFLCMSFFFLFLSFFLLTLVERSAGSLTAVGSKLGWSTCGIT